MTIRTPSNAAVIIPESLPSHDRGNGMRTTPLVTRSLGGTTFITGYTSFPAAAAVPFHSHNCEESVVLMEGRGVLDIDGLEYELKPQDATYIPANVPHRFRNVSETTPMKILWIYASPEATRTTTATGVTNAISAEHSETK